MIHEPKERAPRAPEPFLLLKENRFAHTAVRQLSCLEGGRGPALLFLYGPAGCGKSHLVRRFLGEDSAIASGARWVAITASDFADEFDKASEAKSLPELRASFADVDVLILEDVQALGRRKPCQEMLVCLLDEILARGGRALLTSTEPPGETEGLPARFVNRCHGGVVAGMSPLGRASRVSLLGHLASARQVPASLEALQLLGRERNVSPRELLGLLQEIDLRARQDGQRIDRAFVTRFLSGDAGPARLGIARIASVVAKRFDTTVGRLRSGGRAREEVLPRQCAMYLARELTDESLESIARFFGRKNHSTVLHACQKIEEALQDEPSLRRRLTQVRRELGGARAR